MIRNIGSNALASVYRAVIQFALSLVLTRFVAPQDYAIVAMILPVSLFVLLIGDFGMTAAIVRARAVSRDDLGAAATICAGLGAALLLLDVAAYGAGAYTRMPPGFGGIALAFGVVVFLALAVIVPRASFERRLHYTRITAIETIGTTLGFAAACGSAVAGAGVWSFVVFHLVVQAFRTIVMWWAQRAAIGFSGGWRRALPLMGFGGWLLAFNIVNYCARNVDNYIVAGVLGAGALGLYALAYQVMLVPVQALTWPISGVLLATLSRLHDRPELRTQAFLSAVGLTAMIGLPAACFVALRAPLLFDVLLSPRWHPVGPLAARLAIAGGIQSITSFNGALFVTQGRVRQQFVLGCAMTATILATVAVAATVGGTVMAVANAYLAFTLVQTIVYVVIIMRLLQCGPGPIFGALAGSAMMTLGGCAGMAGLLAIVPHEIGGKLDIALSIIGFGLGAGAALLVRLPRAREALDVLRLAGREGAASLQPAPAGA